MCRPIWWKCTLVQPFRKATLELEPVERKKWAWLRIVGIHFGNIFRNGEKGYSDEIRITCCLECVPVCSSRSLWAQPGQKWILFPTVFLISLNQKIQSSPSICGFASRSFSARVIPGQEADGSPLTNQQTVNSSLQWPDVTTRAPSTSLVSRRRRLIASPHQK